MIKIPEDLYAYDTRAPFENCLVCDRYLLDPKVEYIIEKAYRNRSDVGASEVIFDYAICAHCANKMMDELSTESITNLQRYFAENISMNSLTGMPEQESERAHFMLNHCVVKGIEKNSTEEYQVVARCKGQHLAQHHFPIMLSFDALNELSSLLSQKTQDSLDNFRDKFFPVSPEFEDLFKSKPVLVF
jgi:hypothetical protein